MEMLAAVGMMKALGAVPVGLGSLRDALGEL